MLSNAVNLLLKFILLHAIVASTSTSAPVALPAEIRDALRAHAQSLAAGQTIQWDVVRSSPLTIAQGRKFMKGTRADVEVNLRGLEHVSFTSQADFCFIEHYVDETDKPRPGKNAKQDPIDYSFDGTNHYQRTANAGEAHSLASATQAELLGTHYHDLDESYFRGIAIAMTTTPEAIDQKLPPRSVILNLLDQGAELSAVDHVTVDHQELVRLKIEATDKLSVEDMTWLISIFPLRDFPNIASNYYYLDPRNSYDLVRSEHFDATGFMVIQTECANYSQVDPRPVRLPKSCTIKEFSPNHAGPIETKTITLKSFSTTPQTGGSFTLHDDKPGTYIIEHMDTDHQTMFVVQRDGSLKSQRIK